MDPFIKTYILGVNLDIVYLEDGDVTMRKIVQMVRMRLNVLRTSTVRVLRMNSPVIMASVFTSQNGVTVMLTVGLMIKQMKDFVS